MGKMSVFLAVGVLMCVLEQALAMGTYYWAYPETAAMGYPGAYQPLQPYAAAVVPLECEEEKESSESSSSSESSEESKEEKKKKKGKKEESESSSEEEEKKEESESKEESKEGESKEGESKEESKESKSKEGESKESESEEEESKKEKKKKKEKKPKSLFPPIAYTFPARPYQQYVYSAPYMPYSSVMQAPVSYPAKSNYGYYPVSGGYSAPVVRSYSTAPVARLLSNGVSKYMSPVSYSAPASTYWNPSSNLGYYRY